MILKELFTSEIKECDNRISSDFISDEFKDSIKKFGIINPVKVIEKNNGYLLFSGFKRLDAAKNTLDTIPAIIYPDTIPFCERLIINIKENMAERKLTLFEKISILKKIKEKNCNLKELHLLDSLFNDEKLEKIVNYNFPEIFYTYFAKNEFDKKGAFILTFFNSDELSFLSFLFEKIHLTKSEKYILSDLFLRAKEKGKNIKNILTSKDTNKKELFKKLKEIVFPLTSELNKKTDYLNKKIKGGKLITYPYFEKPTIKLEIEFRGGAELKKRLKNILNSIEELNGSWYED